MIRIHFKNLQRDFRIDTPACRRFLRRAAGWLDADNGELTVIFATSHRIRNLNRRYRDRDESTDVLSFPDGESSEAGLIYLGDIIIAPTVAARNAELYGNSLVDEFAMLLVHGLLHLFGYDHESDQGEMMRRQGELLAALTAHRPAITSRAQQHRS
ncbi:MAG: rRNA maturation RNase YbeY [Acidobacteria bacterium]|nr:rRNA maturation RNase YbeY [Acidobacteriota bacterium]